MNRTRVVIAEDYVLIQEMIRDLLDSECDVIGAVEDGRAAIEMVTREAPDVLLVDVSLPELNGFAVVESLRSSHPLIRVIFVSAYRDPDYVARAFELGAKGYLLKSLLSTELLTAIRTVMAGGVYRSALLT